MQSASAGSFSSEVKQAQDRVARAQQEIVRAAEHSKEIKSRTQGLIGRYRNDEAPEKEGSVEYQLKPAYHNWPKPKKYSTYRDYDIYLDFSDEAHVTKLQKQINNWIKGGYYIIRSEITDIEGSGRKGSLEKLRLVK
ncbi:hypothetical protein [Salinimonas iocasae]|uniref:Uncharacterized protein n=2 Tax=Salinimonas TaxID=288793 RepID=A0A5B7YIJ8_9ALTE|nr:hypothetical protein [Salinimonas iocasae]MBD3587155.1 hypothetical protein [Salinimonas profundi]QCZ95375.1 hypothetical protein FBQ74_17705 [Salinimonas iocasae]